MQTEDAAEEIQVRRVGEASVRQAAPVLEAGYEGRPDVQASQDKKVIKTARGNSMKTRYETPPKTMAMLRERFGPFDLDARTSVKKQYADQVERCEPAAELPR